MYQSSWKGLNGEGSGFHSEGRNLGAMQRSLLYLPSRLSSKSKASVIVARVSAHHKRYFFFCIHLEIRPRLFAVGQRPCTGAKSGWSIHAFYQNYGNQSVSPRKPSTRMQNQVPSRQPMNPNFFQYDECAEAPKPEPQIPNSKPCEGL